MKAAPVSGILRWDEHLNLKEHRINFVRNYIESFQGYSLGDRVNIIFFMCDTRKTIPTTLCVVSGYPTKQFMDDLIERSFLFSISIVFTFSKQSYL